MARGMRWWACGGMRWRACGGMRIRGWACRRERVRISLSLTCVVGRVTVHLTDLPNGQQDDQWHQLLVGTTKVSRGSIRLAARFKVCNNYLVYCHTLLTTPSPSMKSFFHMRNTNS